MLLPNLKNIIFKKITALLLGFALLVPSFLSLLPTSTVSAAGDYQILNTPWVLTGNNGAVERYQSVNPTALSGNSILRLTYDLNGLKLLDGDASAIILDQPNGNWHYVSLSTYGKNSYDGEQTVDIPLSAFPGLDLSKPVGTFHVRFWSQGIFTINLTSALITNPGVVPAPTPVPTPTPTLVPNPNNIAILNSAWNLSGNNGAIERYQSVNPNILKDKTTLTLTYDLHGLKLLDGDASALILDQNNSWHYVSLSKYGTNGLNGIQTVNIPLSDFPGLNLTQPVGTFHVRFWFGNSFSIDILNASVSSLISSTNPTPTPTPSPLPTGSSWAIQSVSSMKESKDKICNQDSQAFINSWVAKAKELGVNYVAVETPYDSPSCGNSVTYSKAWIDAIRAAGLKVWHRHMPLGFEAIYDSPKIKSDYYNMITNYIKNNPSFFKEGDIFTPIPEPQNGGISGITYCASGVCQFDNPAHFNRWLRDAIDVSENAFTSIGLGGKIKIGYYGFDGFVAWGSNNPDWNGILEDATIAKMGNLTIDHYPELIGQTMDQGLDEVQTRYPGVPIIIGEWGSAGSGDVIQQVINSMGAARRPGVIGFNYWHMGMGGYEALINDDFSPKPQYSTVQSFFKKTR